MLIAALRIVLSRSILLIFTIAIFFACMQSYALAQDTATRAKPIAPTYFGWSGGAAAIFVEISGSSVFLVGRCNAVVDVKVDHSFARSWNINLLKHGATVSTDKVVMYVNFGSNASTVALSLCAADFGGLLSIVPKSSRREAINSAGIDVVGMPEYRNFYARAYGADPASGLVEAPRTPVQSTSSVADEQRNLKEMQARVAEEARQGELLQARRDEERRQREFQAKLDEERRQRELLQVQLDEERRKRETQARLEEERRQQQEQRARLEEAQRQQQVAAAAVPKAAAPASRGVRKALIIGNDSYTSVAKLRSARTDAAAVEQAFISVGYAVHAHYDLNEREMKRAIREFMRQVEGGDEVMFFFAGHGVQLAGANYLLPTDIRADDAASVRDEGIALQRVMDDFAETKARLTIAVIDACRDNPFVQAGRAIGGRGLAATNVASGQMIVFSAGAGQQALDTMGANDRSPNGLFTRVFLRHVRQKGVTIDRVMRQVRGDVMQAAKSIGHEQVPALYDQVVGDFYFVP